MKLKNLLHRIPRPVRACICTILAIVLMLSYYVMLGCPTLTMKQEFRRAERAHMVGPSQIVDTLQERQYDEFSKLFVGETEENILFFGKYFTNSSQKGWLDQYAYRFYCLPKTGGITVAPAPNVYGMFWDFGGVMLPVYVFADDGNAVRAELSFTVRGEHTTHINGSQTTESYNESFTAEAIRVSDSGPFRFFLYCDDGKEGFALGQFSTAVTDPRYIFGYVETPTCVTVRLFDANEKLIVEEIQELGA